MALSTTLMDLELGLILQQAQKANRLVILISTLKKSQVKLVKVICGMDSQQLPSLLLSLFQNPKAISLKVEMLLETSLLGLHHSLKTMVCTKKPVDKERLDKFNA
jgi:hypothetical protein